MIDKYYGLFEKQAERVYCRIRRKKVLQNFHLLTTIEDRYYAYDFSAEDFSNMVSTFLKEENWKISAYDLAVSIVERYIKNNNVKKFE